MGTHAKTGYKEKKIKPFFPWVYLVLVRCSSKFIVNESMYQWILLLFLSTLSLSVITDRLETQWWQGLEDINCWGLETWYIGQRCHRVSDDNTFFSDPMISNCCPDNVLVRGFKTMAGKDTFSELYGWPKRHTYWSTFLLNVRNKRVWWCRSDYCFIFISRVVLLTKTPGDLTLKSCFLSLSSSFLSILPSLPDTDPTGQ